MTVYSAKVEQPMKCRTGSPSRDRRVVPSGRKPEALLLADREAEVRARVEAVDALAALRREERDHVVADRQGSRTPSPTASTTPAPSCPSTVGE